MMLQRLARVSVRVAAGAMLLFAVGSGLAPRAMVEAATSASPVHAGCYQLRLSACKIHVEPFAINLSPGQKLVRFRLVAVPVGGGAATTIYDFRPDLSNPLPREGNTITPSLVAKDYAATCGRTYSIVLQGQGVGDSALLTLGSTDQFTCPQGTPAQFLPMLLK
ncbi:MAG TPA: hypothetical protein PKW05_10905 [Anaerolineae bacterium]|nr:hypothetical protein [Anaerolineae bacterium]HQJ52272.1 hypothetical protein [Anaerolineae bacterium]